MLAIISALKTPATLTETGSVVGSFARHLSVDTALLESSLIQLAFQMRSISADTIETATLASYGDDYNGMSIVRMDQPRAQTMIASFANGVPMTAVVGEPLKIQVLNGNGVSGSAGRLSEILQGKGFEILEVGDADRDDFPITTIIVRPEAMTQGQEIIAALGFGELSAGSLASSIDAIVIVGLDADRTVKNG
ncbi:MAG: LytR C-terminal domain-containing protein [Acidimicrobiia bacterium]